MGGGRKAQAQGDATRAVGIRGTVVKLDRGFPLVLLANRDEQYARPSAPVDWWDDQPGILGGRDLQAGGGWPSTVTAAWRP